MRGNKVIAPYITASEAYECVQSVCGVGGVRFAKGVVGMLLTCFGLRRPSWLFLRAVHQDNTRPPSPSIVPLIR